MNHALDLVFLGLVLMCLSRFIETNFADDGQPGIMESLNILTLPVTCLFVFSSCLILSGGYTAIKTVLT